MLNLEVGRPADDFVVNHNRCIDIGSTDLFDIESALFYSSGSATFENSSRSEKFNTVTSASNRKSSFHDVSSPLIQVFIVSNQFRGSSSSKECCAIIDSSKLKSSLVSNAKRVSRRPLEPF